MKTRNKIIVISTILIIGFLTIPFYATNMYCDIFDDPNGGCMRITGIGMIDYTNLPYFVIDSRNTDNPNECWYQEDDGSLTPCKMDGGPSMMMFFVLFWPYIIFGIIIITIFIIWRKRK